MAAMGRGRAGLLPSPGNKTGKMGGLKRSIGNQVAADGTRSAMVATKAAIGAGRGGLLPTPTRTSGAHGAGGGKGPATAAAAGAGGAAATAAGGGMKGGGGTTTTTGEMDTKVVMNTMKRKLEASSGFMDRVKRTVFIDELAPQVTTGILQSALAQFGKVVNIKLSQHPLDPTVPQGSALVEFANEEQANRVEATTRENLLMVGGMPRPVRAHMATCHMFDTTEWERSQPSTQEQDQEEQQQPIWKAAAWGLDNPENAKATRLREVRARHVAEMTLLLNKQKEREEELHNRQAAHWGEEAKKLETINKAGKHHGVDELRAKFGMAPQKF